MPGDPPKEKPDFRTSRGYETGVMSFFRGCNALITGASSGFGAEFARQLAPEAASLILVARRMDRLEALKRELARPGLTIHCMKADLSSTRDIESLCLQVEVEEMPLDLLINNAGLGDHGRFDTSDWKKVEAMLSVNITALTLLTYRLLPLLRKNPKGSILNVSSVASLLPMPKMAVYAATKAYVTSFSEALRAELRTSGVRVCALCPGPVSTEFGTVAERAGEEDPVPAPELMKVPLQTAVKAGLDALAANRPRVIPGLLVRLVMNLTAAMPMPILRLAMKGQAK